jgi:hypothetical protein
MCKTNDDKTDDGCILYISVQDISEVKDLIISHCTSSKLNINENFIVVILHTNC